MVRFCAVVGCTNRSNREKNHKFFTFPGIRSRGGKTLQAGVYQRRLWIEAIKRKDLTIEKIAHAHVCSDHFITGKPAHMNDIKDPDFVPNQKMGYVSGVHIKSKGASARHDRMKRRQNLPFEEMPKEQDVYDLASEGEEEVLEGKECVVECEEEAMEGEQEILMSEKEALLSEEEALEIEEETLESEEESMESEEEALEIEEETSESEEESMESEEGVMESEEKAVESEEAIESEEETTKSEEESVESGEEFMETTEPDDSTSNFIHAATQTDLVKDTILHDELYKLRKIVADLTFGVEAFVRDDKKTLYFTGLPTFSALNSIFKRLIEPYIKITPQTIIQDKFTHFMITLMKLRLNLDFHLLAYMFRVSIQTISRIFYSTLNVLYYRLKNLIVWPSREQLIEHMPVLYKETFSNVVSVIVDCFEVRMEKSSNMEAQASTWSSYKSHNTVKVLIGITPQGTISFVSEAYGGRISDKALTEDCGILNNLLPEDIVLADRGFLIEESVGLHMATVETPAFLKGRRQLSLRDVQHTRNVARLRIHVERVIGSLRQKYTILHNILPMFLARKKINKNIAVINQILTVCSALVNLCPPIIDPNC